MTKNTQRTFYTVLHISFIDWFKSFKHIFIFDYLIISSDVPRYLATELIKEAGKLGIKYHDIREKGAFFVK